MSNEESAVSADGTPLYYGAVEAQLKFLEGKVLTVIDAVTVGSQNKAAKDLVFQQFREQRDHLYEITHAGVSRVGQSR